MKRKRHWTKLGNVGNAVRPMPAVRRLNLALLTIWTSFFVASIRQQFYVTYPAFLR